ncbi:MAG: helix-turn-helix domain-containing protein [Anaerolineales bacterium]|jgi:excisionase family DNA binding protein|nr:helix-turn-helix domain-containing protein [Anaerolineales bacterium]
MAEQTIEVMTIREVSTYLRIPQSSLYKLAQEGKIPGKKVGRHWRFHRAAIDDWLKGLATETPDKIETSYA